MSHVPHYIYVWHLTSIAWPTSSCVTSVDRSQNKVWVHSSTGCPICSWTGFGWLEFWVFHCLPNETINHESVIACFRQWEFEVEVLCLTASFCMGWWEFGRSSWASGNTQIKINPSQVQEQMGHHVDCFLKFSPQNDEGEKLLRILECCPFALYILSLVSPSSTSIRLPGEQFWPWISSSHFTMRDIG